MDFLDPAKKKAHARRLYIGYVLLGVIIMAVTLIIGFTSFGYDLDRKSGEFIQNGLVFLSARPGNADVYINGKLDKTRTDARLALPAGKYTIELKQTGYRPWQRSVDLVGGSIERLVYPVMFPEKLVTSETDLYTATPSLVTQSPDRRWLITVLASSLTNIELSDLSGDNPAKTVLTLPPELLTPGESHTIVAMEWAADNRHVLIEHRTGDIREFVVIDREVPANSFNVNTIFNVKPSKVSLQGKRFDRLYIYDELGHTLQTADVKTRLLTPFLTSVLAFRVADNDQLLYVTNQGAPAGRVYVSLVSGTKNLVLRELPADGQYLLSMARYEGSWYVAVANAADKKVYVYRNPLDSSKTVVSGQIPPKAIIKTDGYEQLSFSESGRFMLAQSGKHFSVYDNETEHRYFYDISLPLTDNAIATWMDAYRLALVSENKVIIFDYDGINIQTLAASSGLPPYFDPNYALMYTLGPSTAVANHPALLRTELKVK